MSEGFTSDSWDTDDESSDYNKCSKESDDSEADSLVEDENFWKESAAADAWLAAHPGGSRLLYPQLFVIKPRRGKVVTPSRNPKKICFLSHLYPEIRNQIYKHCFDGFENVEHPEEEHAPFKDRNGREIQKIHLSSDDVEIKFWLSNALLQTSRQLRFEAMPILFENRVITVEWLPALPRFVEFLGKKGCAMVRYLDIWDTLELQYHESDRYRDIIMSISHCSHLQHLRIVLSWSLYLSDRARSWFDATEWTEDGFQTGEWKHDGFLTEHPVPKLRSEDIKSYWPEYEVLKNLKAQNFTLAVEISDHCVDRYFEFDRTYGAYPEITRSIQFHPASKKSAPSLAPISTSSISPEVLKPFEAIVTQSRSCTLAPGSEYVDSDSEDSECLTWQDTDNLVDKTIPLYNFLRELFHKHIYNQLPHGPILEDVHVLDFVTFPTARKSTGSIMRDCAFCYLSERHCGYHAVPDQPPFELERLRGQGVEKLELERLSGQGVKDNATRFETRFEDLSYEDVWKACRGVVHQITRSPSCFTPGLNEALVVIDYLGWLEMPFHERLLQVERITLDGKGKRFREKELPEVPPWDLLYGEFSIRFLNRNKRVRRV